MPTPPARTPARLLALTVTAVSVFAGCTTPTASPDPSAPPAPTPAAGPAVPAETDAADPAPTREHTLPGVGRATLADIPPTTRQVVLATGDDADANTGTLALYERSADGWRRAAGPWPAHNALRGWTDHHRVGDLRSPVGVYRLTDAGGLLDDPGTRLTYDQGPAFAATGTGFDGEPLTGSFDYVIAINYNRQPGTTPLDWTRPLGAERGGGIWIHVDHDGPTQGCVSIARPHVRRLLRTLDPAKDPVIVMGDAARLAR